MHKEAVQHYEYVYKRLFLLNKRGLLDVVLNCELQRKMKMILRNNLAFYYESERIGERSVLVQ